MGSRGAARDPPACFRCCPLRTLIAPVPIVLDIAHPARPKHQVAVALVGVKPRDFSQVSMRCGAARVGGGGFAGGRSGGFDAFFGACAAALPGGPPALFAREARATGGVVLGEAAGVTALEEGVEGRRRSSGMRNSSLLQECLLYWKLMQTCVRSRLNVKE